MSGYPHHNSHRFILKFIRGFSLLIGCLLSAQGFSLDAKIVNRGDLHWQGKPGEVQFVFISGNEQSQGAYLYRVKFPKGHKITPHFHSDPRVITVLSGSLYVGYGNHFDESAMVKLEAGGLWTEPARQAHYVWAKDSEVELQVMGYGPSVRTAISQ